LGVRKRPSGATGVVWKKLSGAGVMGAKIETIRTTSSSAKMAAEVIPSRQRRPCDARGVRGFPGGAPVEALAPSFVSIIRLVPVLSTPRPALLRL
jgi:hypothetical protein